MRSFPKVARYLSGGKDGGDLYIQLIEQARSFLKPDGRIHFHSVPWSSPDKVARAAQQAGFYLKTLMETRVPWWAKRCNIRSWIARHQNHGSLMINYRKMIVPRGFRVRVAEISRRRMTDSGRRPCGTVRIAWEKVPASWACN